MLVITIREQQKIDTVFEAILSFEGRVEYPVTITDPFTPQDEQQLEWYFEKWLEHPTLDTVKAEQAAASVETYGEQLFQQVFKANPDAYSEYRQLRGSLSQLQIEIVGKTPEFQALHWEALRDPDFQQPLAVDCVVLRKSVKPAPVAAYVQPSPILNLLIVTARPDEEDDVYQLQGLDREARSLLAEKILERHVAANRIPNIRQDPEFERLMKLLAGYPLAMEVVLANLKKRSPKEILEKLQAADINLDTGSEDKTRSILKCVEYSHSNLSPDAQNLLLCLAPFSGFIKRYFLPFYIEQLQKLEPFQDYAFEKFDAAIQEAINWGLLSPLDAENHDILTIQPVFPYFLKTKLEALDDATREALREGFKNHYQSVAGYYQQLMESKDAQERQLGKEFCQLEYENLYTALQICLEKRETVDIFLGLAEYLNAPQPNQRLWLGILSRKS